MDDSGGGLHDFFGFLGVQARHQQDGLDAVENSVDNDAGPDAPRVGTG